MTARMTTDGVLWPGIRGYPEGMGQPESKLPADTLVSAVDNARRGVVTHITIKGEHVAAGTRLCSCSSVP